MKKFPCLLFILTLCFTGFSQTTNWVKYVAQDSSAIPYSIMQNKLHTAPTNLSTPNNAPTYIRGPVFQKKAFINAPNKGKLTGGLMAGEICNNGIDDDADGLVDLNDTADCKCTGFGGSSTSVPSMIPNASFETMACCPSSYSQVNCAQGWVQATTATSDYMNTCGMVFGAATAGGLVPFPSGNGILGTIFSPGWQEYVGSCLLSPMFAGQSYTIQMNIASTPIDGFGNACNGGVIDFGAIDICIFGAPNCADLPQPTTGCPTAPWVLLGQTSYNPVSSWGTLSITFTPSVNINAIMFGSPCILPASYTPPSGCYPYFYYDNLLLNTTNSFGNLTINQTGTPCANNIVITSTADTTGGNWQWYHNGVALSGQTGASINISANSLPPGAYTSVYSIGAQCEMISDTIQVPPPPPVANFSATTVCLGNPTGFTDQSSGAPTSWTWNFGDGNTSTTQNPNNTYGAAGTYTASLIVQDAAGCKDTLQLPVTVTSLPAPTVNSGTMCAGGSVILNASGAVTYSWSPATGLSATTGASVTANPGATTTYTLTGMSGTCSGTNTTTVTVNALPTVTVNSGTICMGQQTSTLNAGGATSYTWSPGTGLSGTTGSSVTANPSSTQTYTVTGIDANNCVNTATASVLVNPLPVIAVNTGTICLGQQTATLTANGASTYAWSPGTGLSATTGTSVNATPGTTTDYTITGTDGNGCISTATTTVVVNALPAPVATTTIICEGATLNLSVNAGTSWSWTGPGGYSSSVQNPNISSATPTATGTYSVTVTDANGCTGATTVNALVNPLPTPTIGSNSPICVNQNLNLTSGGGTGYSWSGPNLYSSTQQNPTISGVTVAATGVYTVTVTDANSCVNSTTVSVTINPLPVVTATGATVCVNATINLGSSGGVTYSWSGPGPYSSNQQNPSITNATSAMSGNYVVTATDANNCSSSNTAQVTVNPLLVIVANNNGPICAGATLNLTSSSGVSWTWSGPNGFSAFSQNGTLTNAQPNLSGTYTVDALDANGCPGSATTNVIVNPLPVPIASNNGPVCNGTTLTFTGSGGPGYSWAGPNGFSSTAQNPSISPVTLAATGTYTLTVLDGNNCVASTTTSALINPLPVITVNSPTICLNNSSTLTANGAVTYSWSPATGLSATVGNNITANPTSTSVYLVTGVDANGCVSNVSSTVTVNSLPPVAVNTTALCLGQTTGTLTASGANTYAWSPVAGLSSSTGASVTANPAATTIYTVSGTDINGCVNTATTTATVNPIPVPAAGPQVSSGCAPVCVNFSNTALVTGTCNWNFGDGSVSASCTPNHCYTGQGTFNAVLTLTDANGCVGTSTATVNVYPVPTADFNPSPQPTTILDPTIHFYDATTGATIASWNWTFGDPNNTTSTLQNPTHVYTSVGSYDVMLYVVSDMGCVDSTIKVIKIDDELMIYVPNAFSPNYDGTNDVFMAKGEGVKDFKMYIFDRWGNLTFVTDDITKGWDGRLMGKGDQTVQEDVYVWKIELKNYKGEPRQLSGIVSLLK